MLTGGGKDSEMRKHLASMLNKGTPTDVEELYHTDGFAQMIARNNVFNNVTIVIILLNTVWIAVDTDLNKAEVLCDAAPIFQIADNFFCTYFFFEIAMRLLSFRRKRDAFCDTWFQFDFALVTLMVWETWVQPLMYLSGGSDDGLASSMPNSSILRVLRIFRLTRVARMARLLRSVPELMILVQGMVAAMRSVMAMLVMLMLVIYIFAVMFVQLLEPDTQPIARGAFENVPQAMEFLLLQVLCGFDAHVITGMLDAGFVYYVLFLTYALAGSYTLMNMLIGVLCEVVSDVAKIEKEDIFLKDLEVQIHGLMDTLDVDGNAMIDAGEFEELMQNSSMVRTLDDLDVDIMALVDFAHFVFTDTSEINFADFFEMVVQFRGSKAATVKDIVDMRKFVTMELSDMSKDFARRIEATVSAGDGAKRGPISTRPEVPGPRMYQS